MTDVPIEAVVIGASAGAVQALTYILPALPDHYRLPVLVVVHVPSDRNNMLVPHFQAKCRVEVREAEDKEPICGGVIYFAPPDYHLLVEADRTIALSVDAPVLFSRPSIDVLFETASEVYGSALAGVILTGANQDGSEGLKSVADAGGLALIENPSSAYAPTMPQAALEACPIAKTMSLEAIASRLISLGRA